MKDGLGGDKVVAFAAAQQRRDHPLRIAQEAPALPQHHLTASFTGIRDASEGAAPQASLLKRSGTGMLPASTGASSPEAKSSEKISRTALVLNDMSMAPATVPAASRALPAEVGQKPTVADLSICFSGAILSNYVLFGAQH